MTGTQTCSRGGQRVCNPLNPLQRAASPPDVQVENLCSAGGSAP